MRNTQTVMAVLQEECAEVIQAVSKINRFGMHGEWQGVTNRQALVTEIGDVLAIIKVLMMETDINITEAELEKAVEAKFKKLEIFLPQFNPYFFLNYFLEGSAHPKHVHSQCTISGIFYLQTPPGSSDIRFTPNQPFRDFFDYMFMVKDPDNWYALKQYDYKPYPGLLLMWPAWLYHEVLPNQSTDPRISIVFNL